MSIEYFHDKPVTAEMFGDLLKRSTLAERRPINDENLIKGMIENSNLVVTAWDGESLIGIARSMTDFHYACYLSDLAVDMEYQQQGIGKALLEKTKEELGSQCKLILIAAPAASQYYEPLGFQKNERCWVYTP